MSSNTPDPRHNRTGTGADGAVRVAGEPASRRNRWLIPLLAALAVLALILLLSRCRGDDASSSAAGATTSTTSAAPAASATPTDTASMSPSTSPSMSPSESPSDTASPSTGAAGEGATGGTILAGNTVVLSSEGVQDLAGQSGQKAVGRAVEVQSVPADEGFWVGSSATDRVWVQLTKTGGESGYTVKKGDTVDFTGTVTPVPAGFAKKVGLSAAEGAGQLTRQGQYLKVKASAVKLSK